MAEAEKERFPKAAKRVKTDFYVDDCLSGSHSTESAIELYRELDGLFKSGNFLLRKWASNDPKVMEQIPPEHRAIKTQFEVKTSDSIKTLGLVWAPSSDTLSFTIDMDSLHPKSRTTKRQLLSDASKLYDPCGILSPIIIKSKIMMQDIWKTGTNWDDFVSPNIQSEWDIYKTQLPCIEQIKIDRWLQTTPESDISLHGFCDSSERAMACCIYLIQRSNGIVTSMLVCSKTRVAPIKTESVPRLLLCGL